MSGHLMEALHGNGAGFSNLTQFEIPSTRASADAQMPVGGDTAYAVELGTTMAHAQSPGGFASRVSGGFSNPTTDPFNMHMMLVCGLIIVGLVLIHSAFKGAVI